MKKRFWLLVMIVIGIFTFTSCDNDTGEIDCEKNPEHESCIEKPVDCEKNPEHEDCKDIEEIKDTYTYNTYTYSFPKNWSPLNYDDTNIKDIYRYLNGSLFEYEYVYDNKGNIISGEYDIVYSAATSLIDVTKEYVGEKWQIMEGEKDRAFKITLRDDLKWENGDPISAKDFVYTMQEMLNIKLNNKNAKTYYEGEFAIANAKKYYNKGTSSWFKAEDVYNVYDNKVDYTLIFKASANDAKVPITSNFREYMGFPSAYTTNDIMKYLAGTYISNKEFNVVDATLLEGKTLAQIKKDSALKKAFNILLNFWGEEDILDFFVVNFDYPEITFDEVGYFVGEKENELIIILEDNLRLMSDKGELTPQVMQYISYLPLIHKETFESTGSYTYCTGKGNTMSWGPYKLENYYYGKQYVMVRNENWYGYNMEEYAGQYQTTKIVCDKVADEKEIKQKYSAGQIDSANFSSINVDNFVTGGVQNTISGVMYHLQLQTSRQIINKYNETGNGKLILTYTDFRNAISLAIDREKLVDAILLSNVAEYGLINSSYYYDFDEGKSYRSSILAKKVLCDIYNIDLTKFSTLDEAVESIKKNDLDEARKLVINAYNAALKAGDIKETDKLVLKMCASKKDASQEKVAKYINEALIELFIGTPLEDRFELKFTSYTDSWQKDFRDGKYDMFLSSWSASNYDAELVLMPYISQAYTDIANWDASKVDFKFTMKNVGTNGKDITATLSILEWYDCLCGLENAKYDFSKGMVSNSQRLELMAKLEEEVLKLYYTIPLYSGGSKIYNSKQINLSVSEYHTFLEFGGIRYITYNYSDAKWEEYLNSK